LRLLWLLLAPTVGAVVGAAVALLGVSGEVAGIVPQPDKPGRWSPLGRVTVRLCGIPIADEPFVDDGRGFAGEPFHEEATALKLWRRRLSLLLAALGTLCGLAIALHQCARLQLAEVRGRLALVCGAGWATDEAATAPPEGAARVGGAAEADPTHRGGTEVRIKRDA
jgi:hypothetical protein